MVLETAIVFDPPLTQKNNFLVVMSFSSNAQFSFAAWFGCVQIIA